MKALIAQLLSADEDSYWDLNYQFVRLGPPARDVALSWLNSPEPRHRERACHVLASVRKQPKSRSRNVCEVDPTPIPYLIRVLENDPDKDVRCAAARALQQQGTPEVMPALLRAARSNDPDICFWVASGLSHFDTYPDELRPLLSAGRRTMLQLLHHPDEDVRDWAAFSAQYEVFNTPAINAALWRLTRDASGDVRGEALSSLAHHGDRRVIPEIRRALQNPKTRVWIWVMEGIVALHAVELIPDLLAHGSSEALRAAQELRQFRGRMTAG